MIHLPDQLGVDLIAQSDEEAGGSTPRCAYTERIARAGTLNE
jgi:hypothetical protein